MSITIMLYPWNEDLNEWNDEGVPFTFGQMSDTYYNKISSGTIEGAFADYGLYIDNVISSSSNVLALAYPSLSLTEYGVSRASFDDGSDFRKDKIYKYKISDTLFLDITHSLLIRPQMTPDKGYARVDNYLTITFKSTIRDDIFNMTEVELNLPYLYYDYDGFIAETNMLNPLSVLIRNNYILGMNAYPRSQDLVEESKTTTGCIIQKYLIYQKRNSPLAIWQRKSDTYGIKGSVVSPYDDYDTFKFYVPEILGYGYEPEFPPTVPDNMVGNYDVGSNTGDFPLGPNQNAVVSGMVRLYQLSTTQMKDFAKFLWSTNLTDWDSFINTLKQWFSNPLDSIISLTINPVDIFGVYEQGVSTLPVESDIKIANYNTGVKGYLCPNNIKHIRLGALSLQPFYSSYLDCNPHTKFTLYLPYIGFKDIDATILFAKTPTRVEIEYLVDIITGVCVANIKVEKESNGTKLSHIIYTFTGNTSTVIPISASSMRDFMSASIGAVASTLAVAGSGGSLTPLVAGSMMAQQGLNVASQKINIAHSGGMSLEGGSFGIQYAYLIVQRPREARADGYMEINGLPSEISGTIGQFRGFTQMSTGVININGATDSEQKEIEQLLKEGIIV